MNFLDTYDIAGSSTPPQLPDQPLNEEVQEVMGQLNRFWGGFRKQSQAAFETARKDFSHVVVQAQTQLTKLTAEDPAASSSNTASEPVSSSENTTGQPETQTEVDDAATFTTNEEDTPVVQNLFSRLQSALPANVVTAVQNNIPDSLKQATGNIDLAQLRSTLSTEFQRVQGVTRAQAEEYMHKSEVLLKDVYKEASDVLKDAVKVIPPEESASGSGLIWDGTDMWMIPSAASDARTPVGKGKQSVQKAVATRAESLLKLLKHDPEILRHDPEADAGVRELYTRWITNEVESKDGGIDGDVWSAKKQAVLEEPQDGPALQKTLDTLLNAGMEGDVFWRRFFFRVHQIESEQEKRKALLEESASTDDDFSWEDEDDDEDVTTKTPLPPLNPKSSTTTMKPSNDDPEKRPSQTTTPATSSPRESSEDSYDVVSEQGKKVSGSDDGDSDWE